MRHLAAGVRTDCETLLNKFVANDEIKFQGFSKVWQEMRFSLIFMGRLQKRELSLFTEECFCIAMSFWDNVNSFEIQVGSIFLLYGLYIKQPDTTREKIRIKNEDWKYLRELIKKCEEKGMYDVVHIFHLLCEKNAFHFVYKANLFGPRTSLQYVDMLDTEKNWDSITYQMNNLLKKRELPHISDLHDQYQEAKNNLAPSMLSTLTLVKDNVANMAIENVKKLLASKNASNNKKDSEDECIIDDDSDNPIDDVGTRRAILKDKLFRSRPTTSRSRRHRTVVSDDSDASPRKKRIKTVAI